MQLSKKKPEVQVLRALAVCVVVLFHLNEDFLPYGFLGVDVFFVISGYVITLGLVRASRVGLSFSASAFLMRRINRLLPSLLAIIITCTVASLFFFSPSQLDAYTVAATYSLAGLSNVFFFSALDYFSAPVESVPLLHTWSLSVEEQFYLLFAAIASFFLGGRDKSWKAFTIVWMVLFIASVVFMVMASHVLSLYWDSSADAFHSTVASFTFYQLPARAYQFSLGILTAVLVTSASYASLLRKVPSSVGLVCFLSLLLLSYFGTLGCAGEGLTAAVLTSLYLISFSGKPRRLNIFLGELHIGKLVLSIGEKSYSVYLVHWPIIAFWSLMVSQPEQTLDYFLLVFAIWIATEILYRTVEIRGKRSGASSGEDSLQPLLIYSILGVSAFNLLVVEKDGLPDRLGDRADILGQYGGVPGEFHKSFYGSGGCSRDTVCNDPFQSAGKLTIVGDSHSRQYADALISLLPDYAIETVDLRCGVTGKRECAARATSKAGSANIDKKLDFLGNFECRKNHIVVISQRWRPSQSYLRGEAKEETKLISEKEVAELVSEFVDEFDGCRRIVIGAVPELNGGNMEACLLAPVQPFNCGRSKMSIKQRDLRLLNDALRELSVEGRYQFIDPFETLCVGDTCSNFIDGFPVYSDSHHLSIWGARAVVNRHANELKAFATP